MNRGGKYFSIYREAGRQGCPSGRFSFARNWQKRVDSLRGAIRSGVHVGIVSTLREPGPLVRKRSRGEKEIYRGLLERLLGLLGDPILRQSSLVLLGVTSRSRRRRGVNCYATRCLHYHISDAICSRELMRTDISCRLGSSPSLGP